MLMCPKPFFNYRIVDEGAVITAFKDKAVVSLKIPERLGGYPVKMIDNFVFDHFPKLQQVTFPENLETIGQLAFRDTALERVTINENIKLVDYYAFDNCSSLQEVTILGKETFFDRMTFPNCINLNSVTMSHEHSLSYFGGYRNLTLTLTGEGEIG